MIPIMAAQLMSFAEVQYRQAELTEEFARVRRGRIRRAQRRAARHARTAAAPALPTATTATANSPAPTRTVRQAGPVGTGIPSQASTDRSTAAAGQRRPAA